MTEADVVLERFRLSTKYMQEAIMMALVKRLAKAEDANAKLSKVLATASRLLDQLECLAMPRCPDLYEASKVCRAQARDALAQAEAKGGG